MGKLIVIALGVSIGVAGALFMRARERLDAGPSPASPMPPPQTTSAWTPPVAPDD